MSESIHPIGGDAQVAKHMIDSLNDEYGIKPETTAVAHDVMLNFGGYKDVQNWMEPQFGMRYEDTAMPHLIEMIRANTEQRGHDGSSIARMRSGLGEFIEQTTTLSKMAYARSFEAAKDVRGRLGVFASSKKVAAAISADPTVRHWQSAQSAYSTFFIVGCILRDAAYLVELPGTALDE